MHNNSREFLESIKLLRFGITGYLNDFDHELLLGKENTIRKYGRNPITAI
jgi:hypothetical protein